jgi:hypothetical protein
MGASSRYSVLDFPDGMVAFRGDVLPDDCERLIDTVRGAGLAAPRTSDSRRRRAAFNKPFLHFVSD